MRHAPRVAVPGSGDVALSAPGTYTLFYEYRGVVGGTAYAAPKEPPALRVTVTATETGERVPLTSGTTTSRYSLPGRAGVALLEFRVDQPGVYRIDAAHPAGQGGPRFVLAVGRGAGLGLLRGLLVGFAAGLGEPVLAVAIAAVVYGQRRQAPRRPRGGWRPAGATG